MIPVFIVNMAIPCVCLILFLASRKYVGTAHRWVWVLFVYGIATILGLADIYSGQGPSVGAFHRVVQTRATTIFLAACALGWIHALFVYVRRLPRPTPPSPS